LHNIIPNLHLSHHVCRICQKSIWRKSYTHHFIHYSILLKSNFFKRCLFPFFLSRNILMWIWEDRSLWFMYSDTVSFRVYGWLLLSNGFFFWPQSKKKSKKREMKKCPPFSSCTPLKKKASSHRIESLLIVTREGRKKDCNQRKKASNRNWLLMIPY
jgi:hypothetical protein